MKLSHPDVHIHNLKKKSKVLIGEVYCRLIHHGDEFRKINRTCWSMLLFTQHITLVHLEQLHACQSSTQLSKNLQVDHLLLVKQFQHYSSNWNDRLSTPFRTQFYNLGIFIIAIIGFEIHTCIPRERASDRHYSSIDQDLVHLQNLHYLCLLFGGSFQFLKLLSQIGLL